MKKKKFSWDFKKDERQSEEVDIFHSLNRNTMFVYTTLNRTKTIVYG